MQAGVALVWQDAVVLWRQASVGQAITQALDGKWTSTQAVG